MASQYLLPDAWSLDDLCERLGAQADPAHTADRSYLETFDGRIRGGGRALFREAGRLVLADASDDRELASCETPAKAVLAAELPPGRLRDLVAPLLDVRAATPVARLRIRTVPLRVLNTDDKTVVRLFAQEPSLGSRRLIVAGVRGYDKALARVARRVERDLGLVAAPPLVEEVVGPGFSSKLDVALAPHQRADSAAVAVLAHLDRGIEANLPGTLADIDSEFLHDLRVAVRRTRSLLRELKDVFPPAVLARFRQEFRWLQQVTGPTRDLDVYLLEFDALAGDHAERLQPLRALLADRRRRERNRMTRALRSERTRTLLADWKQFIALFADLPDDDRPDAGRPVGDVAAQRIATVYRQMVKMGSRIDDASPPEALHDLRKKGKELRYLLEFFARLFPADTVAPMVKTLKALQDTLGRHQDREVQAHMLRSMGDEIARLDDGAAALMAMGVLVGQLEEGQAQARAEFAERFAPFAATERRKAVVRTFGR